MMGRLDLVFSGVNACVGDTQILKDVYGAAFPGQIMAVMGPSGGGKTTLLNAVSGRMSVESGTVTLNGSPLTKSLKRKICYVLQEDMFFPNLTLIETLTFVANIRLPEKMPTEQKLHKLETLIDDLDLRKCLNTFMGGVWMPGLSGGERKRASIACELITDPTIILLDEPSSGLDYKTAFHLVQTLKTYAKQHSKTVVMTIHQPASQIFLQFDLLLLMCDGHSVYYGPPADVTEFFALAGHQMAPHYNPADFILEKLKESEIVKEEIIKTSYNTRQLYVSQFSEDNDLDSKGQSHRHVSWNRLPVRQSNMSKEKEIEMSGMNDLLEDIIDIDETGITDGASEDPKWPTSFVMQYKHLATRALRLSRASLIDKSKIFESVFMCLALSLIWFQLPRTEDTLRDRMGLIFYICMTWGFTPLFNAVTTYPLEKGVIHKERSGGWYRLSAYYLARLTSEVPVILVQPVLVLTIVYLVTGMNGAAAFFATVGTLFIHALTGQSIGLCIGIFSVDLRRGISSATVVIMFTMLLGGLYTRNLPFWLDWSKYMAFLYYTFQCVMILEFQDGNSITCSELTGTSQSSFETCLSANNSLLTIPSEEVLLHYDIHQPFWQYFLPLVAFLIFFQLLGYLLLRFYQKPN